MSKENRNEVIQNVTSSPLIKHIIEELNPDPAALNAAIVATLEEVAELERGGMEELESGGQVSKAVWGNPEDDLPSIAEQKQVYDPLKKVFALLMERAASEERQAIAASWINFVEVFAAIKRHRIELR